jgi:hypothetical protein
MGSFVSKAMFATEETKDTGAHSLGNIEGSSLQG